MECFKCLFVNVFLFCFPNICFPLPQTNVGGVRVGEQGVGQHQPDGAEEDVAGLCTFTNMKCLAPARTLQGACDDNLLIHYYNTVLLIHSKYY